MARKGNRVQVILECTERNSYVYSPKQVDTGKSAEIIIGKPPDIFKTYRYII